MNSRSQISFAVVIAVSGLMFVGAARLSAQAPPDSGRCEAIVRSARVDSVPVGVFVSARRVDGTLSPRGAVSLAMGVAAVFVPPVPLQLSVFSGPARTHLLRSMSGDTAVDLRAPAITGVYRVSSTRKDSVVRVGVVRTSLLIGFDSAVTAAIRDAAHVSKLFALPPDDDSMQIDIRFSTDSTLNSRRILSAVFPRLPVVDALPMAGNPPATFPVVMKDDSLVRAEVVLRFVVDRDGAPALDAVEVVRASGNAFVRAALQALPRQRFRPATVKGCAIAQVIDYPFTFEPALIEPPGRH